MTNDEINKLMSDVDSEDVVYSTEYMTAYPYIKERIKSTVINYFKGAEFSVDEYLIIDDILVEGVRDVKRYMEENDELKFMTALYNVAKRHCHSEYRKYVRDGEMTAKGKVEAYGVSLDSSFEGTDVTWADKIADDVDLAEEFVAFTIEEVIEAFSKEFSDSKVIDTKVKVVSALYGQLTQSERVEKYCEIFGTDSYEPRIRKSVTKYHKEFIEFAKGYLSQQGVVEIDWEVM